MKERISRSLINDIYLIHYYLIEILPLSDYLDLWSIIFYFGSDKDLSSFREGVVVLETHS